MMENKGLTNTYDYDIDKFTSTNQYCQRKIFLF